MLTVVSFIFAAFTTVHKFSSMIKSAGISVTMSEHSKLQDINLENLPFGRYFSDHMLEADYIDGAWTNVEIKPYQPLVVDPSMAALHYGQAIFEGIKAYNDPQGSARVFRPEENFRRFNISAHRMNMPEVPESIFMDGMMQLLNLDKKWIPVSTDHSLYIRPFMFSTDNFLGVHTSKTYKFMIILSPTGPYYSKPMRIYVEEKYTRAAPGGTGYAKAAGNYAASMLATDIAKKKGYDQVLWMDAIEKKYVEEIGTMNVFFVLDGKKVITPKLDGSILDGVTRKSSIAVLRDMGYEVTEAKVSIDFLIGEYEAHRLLEVFGAGTAATISQIEELGYENKHMKFAISNTGVAASLKKRLTDIREGRAEDTYGWMVKID